MPRTNKRNYLTYQHALIYVLTELQNETTGRLQAFHLNTIYAKARQLEERGEINLGVYARRYIFNATGTLINGDILYKTERGFIGFTALGKKGLVLSRARVGSLENLSPFKKSQFFKTVVGGSKVCNEPSLKFSNGQSVPRQKYHKLETIVKTLRKCLKRVGQENRRIVCELDRVEKERDDFQLEMLDAQLEARELQEASGVSGNDDSNMDIRKDSTQSNEPRTPAFPNLPFSSSLCTPQRTAPVTPPSLQSCRTGSFRHRPSGSFLNIVSNQFTPSPSPSSSPIFRSLQLAPEDESDDDVFGAQHFDNESMDTPLPTVNADAQLIQARQEFEAAIHEVNVAKSAIEQRDWELLHSHRVHLDKDKKLKQMQCELVELSEKCKVLEADLNFKTVEWAEAMDEKDQAEEANRRYAHVSQYRINATATALAALQTNFVALQSDFAELQRNFDNTVQELAHSLQAKHRVELEAVGREEELQTRLREAERQLALYKQQVQVMWTSHKTVVLKSMQNAELSFAEMASSSVPRKCASSSRDSGVSFMDLEANDFNASSDF
ncbi:hypothetical protein BU17DRAFT_90974 [Hysterangium stoloniferum]|nr:hypothetical protein BU17DRAFT_90974 [Hysterangium stoloniferum]